MTEKTKDQFDDLLDDLNLDDQIKHNMGFDLGVKDNGVTYAIFIGDHSGSMGEPVDRSKEDSPLKKDLAMSNFNEQIATLKSEADDGMEVLITAVDFDNEIIIAHDNVDVQDIEPLVNYWTRGMTSLYDAIANGIARADARMEKDPREDKAVLVIIETDGYENASKDYSSQDGGRERLRDLIKEKEDTGKWTFTFLGAGLDEKFASDIGMRFGNTQISKAGDIGDTVYAYAAQTTGMKNFMTSRKMGCTAKTDFYAKTKTEGFTKNDEDGGEIR